MKEHQTTRPTQSMHPYTTYFQKMAPEQIITNPYKSTKLASDERASVKPIGLGMSESLRALVP
jgi:hypothetical protein